MLGYARAADAHAAARCATRAAASASLTIGVRLATGALRCFASTVQLHTGHSDSDVVVRTPGCRFDICHGLSSCFELSALRHSGRASLTSPCPSRALRRTYHRVCILCIVMYPCICIQGCILRALLYSGAEYTWDTRIRLKQAFCMYSSCVWCVFWSFHQDTSGYVRIHQDTLGYTRYRCIQVGQSVSR